MNSRSEFMKGNTRGFKVGNIPHNKGLPKEQQPFFNRHHTKKSKDIISLKKIGEPSWNKNKKGLYHHTEETKNKISIRNIGKHAGDKNPSKRHEVAKKISETRIRLGIAKGSNNYFYGKHLRGTQSPSWKGGPRLYNMRAHNKIRRLGYHNINLPFEGSHGHHIDKEYVIYIPKWLHRGIYHVLNKQETMEKINRAVWIWYIFDYNGQVI